MIDMRDGQRSLMSIKFFSRNSALLVALFATPARSTFDAGCDVVPVARVFRAVHRHDCDPLKRSSVTDSVSVVGCKIELGD